MFIQQQFKVDSAARQLEFIKKYPLGTIVTCDKDGHLIANHFPFLCDVDDEGNLIRLRAHFARINEQAEHLKNAKEVLVVFQAPEAYISPSWYKETKPLAGKVVPTWDFVTVHVYGKPTVIDDSDWIHQQMCDLTEVQEQRFEHQWKVEDAPENYRKLLRKAVHGLQIEVTKVEGKWKLSQDKKAGDIAGVMEAFRTEVGGEMGSVLVQELEACLSDK